MTPCNPPSAQFTNNEGSKERSIVGNKLKTIGLLKKKVQGGAKVGRGGETAEGRSLDPPPCRQVVEENKGGR